MCFAVVRLITSIAACFCVTLSQLSQTNGFKLSTIAFTLRHWYNLVCGKMNSINHSMCLYYLESVESKIKFQTIKHHIHCATLVHCGTPPNNCRQTIPVFRFQTVNHRIHFTTLVLISQELLGEWRCAGHPICSLSPTLACVQFRKQHLNC